MIISARRILRREPDDDENRREEISDDKNEMKEEQKSTRRSPRFCTAELRDQNKRSHEENDLDLLYTRKIRKKLT